MIRTTLLAAASLIAVGGAAFAQSGPVITGGGDDMTITYPDGASQGTIVGGGVAVVTGGGDNREITYATTLFPEPGRVASMVGGGDNAVITYQQPAATAQPTGIATAGPDDFRG